MKDRIILDNGSTIKVDTELLEENMIFSPERKCYITKYNNMILEWHNKTWMEV